ncbi:hypothetical protein KQX54_009592 [Cotesia glomerata]|uniref:Metalloendopeptidase n=1 Tax=Cotesia glomerata TaxID=32391 RepID=A0AAV7IVX3_COTGL|nr:hypothetical protein KQX54_009592 [Cotesia glomerata]
MNDSRNILNYKWKIPVSSGGKVAFKILSLNIPKSPGCVTDYLEVRKARYCGNYTNLLLIDEDMTVKYVRTQRPNEDEGFLAIYRKICGGEKFIMTIMSNDPITIQSPNYPSDYQPNSECLWEFTVLKYHKTTIHFDYFNLELSDNCTFDHVQIWTYNWEEGSPRIHCGKQNPWNIILSKKSVVLKDTELLWYNEIIPYEFKDVYTGAQPRLILQAMRRWEEASCITFVKRNEKVHRSYLFFTKINCGCCSTIGRVNGGKSTISIYDDCDKFGTTLHELEHAIGFFHEHEHPDRDEYVKINFDNIKDVLVL